MSVYTGTSRKLVVAFDIGTTFSGVSYCVLDPGSPTEIRTVTRFPCQAQVGGDSKIPTIIWYDQEGNPALWGAEAVEDGVLAMAEDEQWVKAEWFKLLLRPRRRNTEAEEGLPPSLPPNKTVVEVIADFMKYLYTCTKDYIADTESSGKTLWETLEEAGMIHYVITHPNGWEGFQQSQLRESTVLAGLVPETEEGRSRISFVTEGEASLHFCVRNGLAEVALKEEGKGILIVDAGGGTVDISTYRYDPEDNSYQEIAAPQCLFQGSVFVTNRAREYLTDHLQGSRFEPDLDYIVQRFDKGAKIAFRDDQKFQYVQFARASENEPSLNIRSGQLKLEGRTVASFFEPSIRAILDAIEKQCMQATHAISTVLLVGGFAASDWLNRRLKDKLEEKGIELSRPDRHTNKAVSDGGVSFFVDNMVKARVAKSTYGVRMFRFYNPRNPEHKAREHLVEICPVTGAKKLRDIFSVILPKDTCVNANHTFKERYNIDVANRPKNLYKVRLYRYDGPLRNSVALDEDPENFSLVCIIEADLSHIDLRKTVSLAGKRSFKFFFDIVLHFGLTELKAHMEWMENGEEKRSPAKIIYNGAT